VFVFVDYILYINNINDSIYLVVTFLRKKKIMIIK
jgi:hypothetical protein